MSAAPAPAAVRERPILFSGEMVRAILAGTKTQTRRVIVRPERYERLRDCAFACPHGVPGERLWVREAWALRDDVDWRKQPEKAAHYVRYREGFKGGDLGDEYHRTSRWRSGRFMPRILSRITLELTAVRVQRLQEISEEDLRAEGMEPTPCWEHAHNDDHDCLNARRMPYLRHWNALNRGRGYPWESTPWVWALTFRRLAT